MKYSGLIINTSIGIISAIIAEMFLSKSDKKSYKFIDIFPKVFIAISISFAIIRYIL
ncbi:MAG: hypothetical protein ACI4DY_07705 [Monoglobaceae bacterium]